MFALILLLLGCFYCTDGMESNTSVLTSDQAEIWFNAISQINRDNQTARIDVIQLGATSEISLYGNEDRTPWENRHLFKQNIHKQIHCYVYQNQLNSNRSSNIYDPCHGALFTRNARANIAGTYVYTANQTGHSLGLILVELPNSLHWFNHTKSYVLDQSSAIRNGTELFLGFQCHIYYNSNSDLLLLNEQINDIVQQAHVSIESDEKETFPRFFLIENLICQRHEQIVYDDLRLLTIVCTTKMTFHCPLSIGSSCWIENKRLSNIQFHIHSQTLISNQTLTIRIDV